MNTKFKYISVICLLLAIGLSGCDKEEIISSETGVDNLKPADSNEPLDHYIYEFYNNYDSYILYEYDDLTYQWDFSSIKQIALVRQKDKEVLLKGVQYMEETFVDLYPEEFKKKYIPVKILLADSINEMKSRPQLNKFTESGTAYIAIGQVHEGIDEISNETFNQAKAAINYEFWMGYLLTNGKLDIPEAFYKPSEGLYHVNLKALSENEDNSSIDPKKYGFWADQNGKPHTGSRYYWTAQKEGDVKQFFEKILTYRKDEMLQMMEGYPKLQDKYNVLVAYVQDQFNFDIQSISKSNK